VAPPSSTRAMFGWSISANACRPASRVQPTCSTGHGSACARMPVVWSNIPMRVPPTPKQVLSRLDTLVDVAGAGPGNKLSPMQTNRGIRANRLAAGHDPAILSATSTLDFSESGLRRTQKSRSSIKSARPRWKASSRAIRTSTGGTSMPASSKCLLLKTLGL